MQRRDRGRGKNNFKRKPQQADRNIKRRSDTSGSQQLENAEERASRNASVKRLLTGIGTPKPSPIVPDPFQLDALETIATQDVLVTAPTGSGKTWIAREEIRRLLADGKRSWYTTPLKALTNSKYSEFCKEFGPENVGILTGDRKENHTAPLIVGTTEIYRNQLFDSLRGDGDVEADLVIFDEAHYFSDEDRGHVWEEAIILSPSRIRMLLLSATVGGADDFANWIAEIRGIPVKVITAGERPVELRAGFLSNELELFPLLDETGNYNRSIDRVTTKKRTPQAFDRRRRKKK